MASDTVQLGKLTIITELGCIIGSGQQAQIRIQEDHVQPRKGSLFIQCLDSRMIWWSLLLTRCYPASYSSKLGAKSRNVFWSPISCIWTAQWTIKTCRGDLRSINFHLRVFQHCERVKHMDRLKIGTTIIILHVHEPGETCDACRSGDIISELPETLQSGMLNGEMQKAFLEKSEAERIREFYNFDRYCWGPGMSKAAQEEVRDD